jgi:hypothetical protein
MSKQKKETLYIEIPGDLKKQMGTLATLHTRSLTGEVVVALQEYLAKHQHELPDRKPK